MENTKESKIGIGNRPGNKRDKLNRKKGDRNRNSKHTMRVNMGMKRPG